jgi:hypothetical protein
MNEDNCKIVVCPDNPLYGSIYRGSYTLVQMNNAELMRVYVDKSRGNICNLAVNNFVKAAIECVNNSRIEKVDSLEIILRGDLTLKELKGGEV